MSWGAAATLSVVSMVLGFWDLYRNVPVVREALSALSARLMPLHALFEWIERHAQIRCGPLAVEGGRVCARAATTLLFPSLLQTVLPSH